MDVSILICKKQRPCFILALLILVIITISSSNRFIYSDRCVSDNPKDVDGDNIPNDWEENGVDVNNDGDIDTNPWYTYIMMSPDLELTSLDTYYDSW